MHKFEFFTLHFFAMTIFIVQSLWTPCYQNRSPCYQNWSLLAHRCIKSIKYVIVSESTILCIQKNVEIIVKHKEFAHATKITDYQTEISRGE